jgi:prepilin-type processing-associated H-X9-DG protein
MRPWIVIVLSVLLTAPAPVRAQAGAAPPPAVAVAPVLGEEVFAVLHVDLTKTDVPALLPRMLGKLADENDVRGTITALSGWTEALKKAGAKELFVLLDALDMPGLPVLAVPLTGGADGRAIAGVLLGAGIDSPLKLPASETIRDVVIAGSRGAVARIRNTPPAARPELARALAAAGDLSLQIAIIPSATQRRALEESLPQLPAELGGAPITTVTQGLLWALLTLAPGPEPALLGRVQTRDAGSAMALGKILKDALGLVVTKSRDDPPMVPLTTALGQLKLAANGDRIELEADLAKVAEIVALPFRRAREAAQRAQCTNQLKQLGLAMHNFHSNRNTFPPAYTTGKDGKPLLSWRVQLLPFLDAKALYDEFHLDEPWDSPHNKALITRMPSVYACPSARPSLRSAGKTTYLTPRGPATMFPGAEAIKIQDITDGTSNTIMVVDASDDAAVIWTKPDDWDVAPEFKAEGLFGHHTGGTTFLFGDGSVRFLREKVASKVLQKLTTGNGGEVIDASEF